MNRSEVYFLLDPSTGEVFYVGIGRPGRSKVHLSYVRNSLKKNPNFEFAHSRHQRIAALLENGVVPTVQIVLEGLSRREAQRKEIEFIKHFGRADLGTGTLTNRTKGGEWISVCPRTEVWLERMSASAKIAQNRPEVKKLKSEALRGKKRTPEQIERIRLGQLSIRAETSKKRRGSGNPNSKRCSVNGIEFGSIEEAATSFGVKSWHLRKKEYNLKRL